MVRECFHGFFTSPGVGHGLFNGRGKSAVDLFQCNANDAVGRGSLAKGTGKPPPSLRALDVGGERRDGLRELTRSLVAAAPEANK